MLFLNIEDSEKVLLDYFEHLKNSSSIDKNNPDIIEETKRLGLNAEDREAIARNEFEKIEERCHTLVRCAAKQ